MVDVRGERSSIRCIRASVPQGPVLGLVLYNIFTADLPYPRELGTLLATYADDTAFIANSTCRNEATQITQNFLNLYGEWMNRWNILIIGNKSQHCNFSLRSKILPRVKFPYLSLILDKHLTWRQHITKITATCRAKLRKLHWMLKGTS